MAAVPGEDDRLHEHRRRDAEHVHPRRRRRRQADPPDRSPPATPPGSRAATSGISKVVAAKAPAAALRRINGTARADRLTGTARAERIDGKGGNDRIDGKGGKDVLIGGAGNDTILAFDGIAETITCGPGKDFAMADRTDKVSGCERVTRKGAKKKAAAKKR